jgi:hypothetical protein
MQGGGDSGGGAEGEKAIVETMFYVTKVFATSGHNYSITLLMTLLIVAMVNLTKNIFFWW